MAPAQQALAEGDMAVFETYETEHELLRRPVFRWDSEVEPKAVAPGRKAVLTVACSGKVGWCVISPSTSRNCFLQHSLKHKRNDSDLILAYPTRRSYTFRQFLHTTSLVSSACYGI